MPAGASRFTSSGAISDLPVVPKHVESLAVHTVKPIEEAKNLHPSFYVDEQYSQVEAERVFGMNWFCVGHTQELTSPGDVKVVDIGDSLSFILTKDKQGELHAFYNTCSHRGAKLCTTSATNCKQLVCPYHWWAYRLDGTLKSTPPACTPKERKENLSLREVPGLEVFAGMIFLNQQPNPPPLADSLGDLPQKLERYDFEDMELHDVTNFDIKGNWKLVAENFVDFYHINAVHPGLAPFSRVEDHLPNQGKGQYVGFVTSPLTDCGGPGDKSKFNVFPRINKMEQEAALFFHIFPNVSLTVYPHSVYTLIAVPGEQPGTCREQLAFLMAPGARLASDSDDAYKEKKQALMEFVSTVNREDVVAIENVQKGLRVARKANKLGEFLAQYDWGMHRFQNMLVNALQGKQLDYSVMPNLASRWDMEMAKQNEGMSMA